MPNPGEEHARGPSKPSREDAEQAHEQALAIAKRHADALKCTRQYGRVEIHYAGGRPILVRTIQDEKIA